MSVRSKVDCLVVGAGPAGIAFGLAATMDGASVAIVERPGSRKVGEIVSPTIRSPLAALGAWDILHGCGPIALHETISLWGEHDGPVRQSCLFNPYGPSWSIDRDAFESGLLAKAQELGVIVLHGCEVQRNQNGVGWRAFGRTTGADLLADTLIVATGRSSCPIGMGRRRRRDRLVGILRYGRTQMVRPVTVVEATASGWWYCGPLAGGGAVTAYMTDADLIDKRSDILTFWLARFAETRLLRDFSGEIREGEIVVRPAGGSLRQTLFGTDWVAIGEAASSYDPICGQGVATAMSKGPSVCSPVPPAGIRDRRVDYIC